MLLSEENERLRTELERMKQLAATLLTSPPSTTTALTTLQLGNIETRVKPFDPIPSASSNSFQLSLAQPTGVTSFEGATLQSELSSFNNLSSDSPPILVSQQLSRTTSLQEPGRFAQTLHIGRQGSLGRGVSFGNGGFDGSVSAGGPFPFALEDIKHFTGTCGVTPSSQNASSMLAFLSQAPPKRDMIQPKKEDPFVYPNILSFEKQLADPFKCVPATFVSTAPLSVSLGEDLEDGSPKKGNTRKRDRDNSEENRKMRLSKEQSMQLEAAFKEQSTHSPKHKTALAHRLGLRPRQVEVWFQNRRARTKLKQTEIDCEVLKRCCETLTEENRRLQKEVIALKARQSMSGDEDNQTNVAVCVKCKELIAPVKSESVQERPGDFEMVSDKAENDASDQQPAVNSNGLI